MRFFRIGRTKPSTQIEEKPDHILNSRGLIALNEAGSDLAEQFAKVERPYQHLRQAWVGAILARLFQRYAWLQSLTVTLTCEIAADLDGGQCTSFGCAVTRVAAVPGADLPEPLLFAGGFDDMSAMALLDANLAIDGHDLCVSIIDIHGHSRHCALTVTRPAIQSMLNDERLSGIDAYNAWFRGSATRAPLAAVQVRKT